MANASRFEGKTAIVTGAASGIGRAALVRLVSEGAIALAVDLNEAGLNETLAQAAAASVLSVSFLLALSIFSLKTMERGTHAAS